MAPMPRQWLQRVQTTTLLRPFKGVATPLHPRARGGWERALRSAPRGVAMKAKPRPTQRPTRISKPGKPNTRPDSRNASTRISKPGTRNPKPETKNLEPETQNAKSVPTRLPPLLNNSLFSWISSLPASFNAWEEIVSLRHTDRDEMGSVSGFRGGLVFKAHSLSYHSTLGLTVVKKKKKSTDRRGLLAAGTGFEAPLGREIPVLFQYQYCHTIVPIR